MSQLFSALDSVPGTEVRASSPACSGWSMLSPSSRFILTFWPWLGSHGISPVQPMLRKIAADFPAPQRYWYFPTLLWISAGDTMLRAIVASGVLAGLVAVVGGPFTPVALLVCWLAYLSLDKAVGLVYPWDALLLEAGFLALFLPPLLPLPSLAAVAEPAPLLAWAFSWLLFRVVFGFGKFKFSGADRHDTSYLHGFLINQPMPTRLGWYAHHLPHRAHSLALKLMFVVEVLIPFLIFVPGDARVVAAVAIGSLMIAIQLSGNFGFFNLLVLALCVPLLVTPAAPWFGPYALADLPMLAVLIVVMLGGLLNLPFNSWCAQSWHYWPSQFALHTGWLRRILDFYRLIQPLRVTHAYGIFPPTSSPPMRWIAQIEGSDDGTTWRAYPFRWLPTGSGSPPPRIAPFHPRLDHAHYYEGFGTAGSVFLTSLFGTGNPYQFSRVTLLERLVQRLLEGEPVVLRLFAANPFPAGPPARIRVRCYQLQPISLSERRRTGAWWSMSLVGDQLPGVRRDDALWQRWLSEPELFHWDELIWKRRTPAIRALVTRAQSSGGPLSASILPATGLTAADVEAFWNEFVPAVAAADRSSWIGLTEMVRQLRARFGAAQLARFDRVLARLSVALAARLEPAHFGPSEPRLMPDSYFHLYMLIHSIVCRGREAYEAAADPATAFRYAEDFSPAEGLYLCGIFWYELLIFQARKLRLLMPFNEIAFKEGLPGFIAVLPFLAQQFHAETNDSLPIFAQSPRTGAWTVVTPASVAPFPAPESRVFGINVEFVIPSAARDL